MKKNITINMQGRLYPIDEDAYELLKQYEDSLRGYFSGKDGGIEIVDDIEARIAELFDEVMASGKAAIDISDVQRIITRIGNPQQMDDGQAEAAGGQRQAGGSTDSQAYGDSAGQQPTGDDGQDDASPADDNDKTIWGRIRRIFVRKGRRLYRDPKDKKLFGVLSGLSHYYGGDVTIWRIIVLAFGVIFLTTGDMSRFAFYMLIVYFVLGMVLPEAVTPEDRLRMNGKNVDPQNLAEEVTAESKTTANAMAGNQPQGCLSTLGSVVTVCLKVIAWIVFGSIVLGFIGLLVVFLLLLFAPTLTIFADHDIAFAFSDHPWTGTIGLVSFVMLIVLIVYGAISSRDHKNNISRLLFAILLIASLVGSITCATIIISDLRKQIEKIDISMADNYRRQNTHNGIFVKATDWDYLSSKGWNVLLNDNNDHLTASGEYYTGNTERTYLDSFNGSGKQRYWVERADSTLAPGTYSLTAVVRSDGPGVYIYAIADSDGKTFSKGAHTPYTKEIPAEGNTGGQIWQDAKADIGVDDSLTVGRKRLIKAIVDTNDGNGYGWSRITIKDIKTKRGYIRYGVTTEPAITNDQFAGTWFSADDFKLTKE